MKVILSPKAKSQLQKLSKIGQIIITKKIRSLIKWGTIVGEEKLKGYKNIYRVRAGDYRIIYRKMGRKLRVVLVGHRKNIYKLVDKLFK